MTPKEKHDLASALFAANRREEALTCLRSLLAEEDSSAIWHDYAVMNFAVEQFEEAEAAFRVALSLDAHNAQAAFSLGALHHQQSRLEEALPSLKQGLDSPDPAERSAAEQLISTYPAKATLEPAWDPKKLEQYLRAFLRDDANERSYFETHVRRYIATLQALPDGNASMRLLELGAAFHHLTPALRSCKSYRDVRCTDIWHGAPQETRVLRSNLGDEEMRIIVDNFDLQLSPWPYSDEAFDVVLCCEILEHLHTDPLGLFAEINRILKPCGVLLLTTPNLASAHAVEETLRGGSPYGYGKFEIGGKPTDRHNREYTAGEVERLALAAGFEIVALRTHTFYWPAKHEVMRLIASQGHPIARRGDATFLLARKHSAVLERYPDEFYAREGVQSDRREKQSDETSYVTSTQSQKPQAQNILLVHEILPHFDCSGADLRLFELVRELTTQGNKVTLLARDGRDYHRYAPPLQTLGANVVSDDPDRMRHIGNDTRTQWNFRELLDREQFDVAILSHWFWSGISVPEHYLDDIRLFSPATRILVLSEDRHGERERRSWHLTHLLSDLERGNDFEQREMEIYDRADLVLYVTETDQCHFLSLHPHLQTEHLPTIAEVGTPGGPFREREGVLFLGNFENLANRDALQWLLREVWPIVSKASPDIKLYVAGHGADPALAKDHPEIVWLGKVPDLAQAFAARRVFAAPIRYGTGIITKNMHALAHGLPVITTSVGAEGMQLVHDKHALIADDPKTFADSIVRLYNEESLWNDIAKQGSEFIRSKFSLPNLQSQIRKILARAAGLQPKPFEPGHIWSYRAVEKTNPEVLAHQPAVYRGMLRLLAYWQQGRQHLDQNQPAEALRQYRHVFTLVRGRLSELVVYSQLLQDMSRCYRELRNPQSASICEREALNLIPGSGKPLPPRSSKLRHKKSGREPLDLSVVIPTYNRTDKLRLCLAALAFQTLPADRWEVIVVDDGSSDDTESFCRNLTLPYPNLHYIRQENRGAGAARRLGVEAANGEILLLCNDDTIADNRLLAEHLRVHRDNPTEKWAVLGDFVPSDETAARALSFFVNISEFFFPQKTLKARELYDQTYFVTCNLSIRRDAVLAAGNFDPEFRVAEDTELGTRLLQRGYRVCYHPDAVAWHEHASFTTDDLIRRAQRYGIADWALFRKHPHLLGTGAGVFGTLSAFDELRMQQLVDSNRQAIATGLTALRTLDDIDFRAMVHNSKDKGQAAKEAMRQMTQVVPLVYWHHLFETFLKEWRAAKNADTLHSAAPSEQTQAVEAS